MFRFVFIKQFLTLTSNLNVIKRILKMQVVEQIMDEENSKKIRRRKKQLYRSILQQMEFYFSDANLKKDRFLGQLTKRDPYVDLSVFLNFNKISALTNNIKDIVTALEKSTVLQLSENKEKVCRISPIQDKENEDACTIYVERLPDDTEHEWLKEIFSMFGTVDYVSLPKYKHNKRHKGFAFIEFKNTEDAIKALTHFESIGCKLPTQMPPNQLISIVNFEPNINNVEQEDKQEDEIKTNNEILEENENKNVENELNVDISKDDVQVKEINKKKRKLSQEAEEEIQNKKAKSDDNFEDVDESCDEYKKKRKRRKIKKQPCDFKQLGLRVLSKKEWKQLRNKYLNMQRIKMKSLKENLHRKQYCGNEMQTDNVDSQIDQKGTKESEPRFQFKPRCIVEFIVPETCADLKKLKVDIRQNPGIEFVDVDKRKDKGYIRFSDEEFTDKFMKLEYFETVNILEGQEEQDYWEKITKDRSMKLQKNPNKKVRGREKLLKRAEHELGKHIRFEN